MGLIDVVRAVRCAIHSMHAAASLHYRHAGTNVSLSSTQYCVLYVTRVIMACPALLLQSVLLLTRAT